MSTDALPGIPRPEKVIRVHVHSATKLLRVDTAKWNEMSEDEREDYLFDAALELNWFDFDFAEATQ